MPNNSVDFLEERECRFPVLSVGIQKKIAEMVNASFCNREFSKQLLGIAKRGVEIAIEKDEKQAQMWMDSELKKLNMQ